MSPRRNLLALAAAAGMAAAGLAVAVAAPASAAPVGVPTDSSHVRVWSGTTSYTDDHNETWNARTGFTGPISAFDVTSSVNNLGFVYKSSYSANPASDPDNRLWGNGVTGATGWSAPVSNGRYRVELRLLDPTSTTAGQRVFSVKAEGIAELTNVDIAAAVGQKVSTERMFNVNVSDGVLDLAFTGVTGVPVVSSIRADMIPASFSGRPGPGNTGPAAGPKTVVGPNHPSDGTYRLAASASNLDIHANVIVIASNVTLSNSVVRGSTNPGAMIAEGTGVTGFTLVDSRVRPTDEHITQSGVLGFDYTVLRSEITGTTDGVNTAAPPAGQVGTVTVRDSWLHDTRFINSVRPAPQGSCDSPACTHNDGVQVAAGGSTVLIDHNTITGNSNSVMQLSPNATTVTFTDNFVDDGGASINVGGGTATVTNNVFWRHQRLLNCAILGDPGTVSGNTFADDGTPVVARRGC